MYKALQQAHPCDIVMNTAVKAIPTDNPPDSGIHTYRVSAANKAVCVLVGVIVFWGAGWLCAGLFVPHLRARLAHQGWSTTADLVVTLALFGFALFTAIRPFQMHLTIMNSQVEVTDSLSSHKIPFADIRGRRFAGGRGGSGMYLYRRGKSRVFVRESMLQLDDFYKQWRASIYDLDKAERLKRKAVGKERMTDWFAVDNDEQHPAIGGPDAIV
jgi:hypothetical protein